MSTQASPPPPRQPEQPSQPTQPPQPAAGSSKTSLTAMIAQHGVAAVLVYGTINMAGLVVAYSLIKAGLIDSAHLVQLLVDKTPVERWTGLRLMELDPIYANGTLAYAVNILLEPVRLFGTVMLAPRASRWWQARRGWPKSN